MVSLLQIYENPLTCPITLLPTFKQPGRGSFTLKSNQRPLNKIEFRTLHMDKCSSNSVRSNSLGLHYHNLFYFYMKRKFSAIFRHACFIVFYMCWLVSNSVVVVLLQRLMESLNYLVLLVVVLYMFLWRQKTISLCFNGHTTWMIINLFSLSHNVKWETDF